MVQQSGRSRTNGMEKEIRGIEVYIQKLCGNYWVRTSDPYLVEVVL